MIQFPQFIQKPGSSSDGEYLDKNTKFLFHHIPKTAGSTLRGILEGMFEVEEVCPAETVEELSGLSKNEFDKYRLYAGHFSYGAITTFLPDAVWVTFLREPNERVISQYHNHINDERIPDEWLRRVEKNSVWKEYMEEISGCTLQEWLTLPNKRANSITCNRQTQAFLPQQLRVAVEDWSVYDEKLVSLAKENLEKNFTFFGIQEYFE
ncbi:MAG: sulfotransferase family 2 domain-containing protein [Lentisphaeraceae bacterium]|nr:sulfotransferase family 2 domain-containing protein [Lentisphaeraceae bacterium]